MTLDALVHQANSWCDARGIAPANGQSAPTLSARTLRYYRTFGLLDPPTYGGGDGYGEKHLLQLIGIRILQNQGLPLNRIQTLLYGRTPADLRAIADQAGTADPVLSRVAISPPRAASPAPCPGYALGDGHYLICGSGKSLSADQLRAIREILGPDSSDGPARHKPSKQETER